MMPNVFGAGWRGKKKILMGGTESHWPKMIFRINNDTQKKIVCKIL